MRKGVLLGVVVAALALPAVAGAATFRVTKVRDGVPGSLRAAIDRANATASSDTIVLVGQRRQGGRRRNRNFQLTRCVDPANEEDANADGDLDYTDDANLVIRGKGGSIRNTCAGERVLHNDGLGTLTIRNATVRGGNSVGNGGGILSGGPLIVVNSVIRANHAEFNGGGLGLSGGGRIADSLITGNTAELNGGGLQKAFGELVFEDDTVRGNRAELGGGGIHIAFDATTITGTTINSNQAGGSGGGISKSFDSTTIENSTVSGNRAEGDGGGIQSAFNTTTIQSSTVTANTSAGSTGGVQKSFDDTTIAKTIVAGNSGAQCSNVTSLGFNLTSDATCDPQTSDRPDTNARLLPLANNGGPTRTHALAAGSPAINWIPADQTPTRDQRGAPRDGEGDIGAYELVRCAGIRVNRVGTGGRDRLIGTGGRDGLIGLGGRDRLSAKGSRDGLCGGSGADLLRGGSGNDKLNGGQGRDRCNGGAGGDTARQCEVASNIP